MNVREAIERIFYGEDFILKGANSGKVLHNSRVNKTAHLEQFLDLEVTRECFFTDLFTPNKSYMGKPYTYPMIGIWVQGM